MLTGGPFHIEIAKTPDWISIAKDGKIIADGHTLRERDVLKVLMTLGVDIKGHDLAEVIENLGHKVDFTKFGSSYADEDDFMDWEAARK